MERILKTSANYQPHIGEINVGISQTMPDQSLSVREILTKYANGTLSDHGIEPQFNEDSIDLRGMDYVEIYQLQEQNRKQIDELQKRIGEAEAERKKRYDMAKDEEISKLRQELEEIKNQ